MTLRPYDVIAAKRDGKELTAEQIQYTIRAYTAGDFPDYAMGALLMAIFIRGMTKAELEVWTREMLHSGKVLDLSKIPGARIDKHSTGGVGDKISLPLAPLVAACGVRVPMVSGRGLGHTGGTLDKLESIAGFNVEMDAQQYAAQVQRVGACLIGQTAEIAPADKKLYALRDVTATVESIPLIASSIMSKKLAEGIDGLVLDVKVGKGAFMKNSSSATTLAKTMVEIGKSMGKKVVALLTNMDQPLGRAVGNSLEVKESIAVLRGEGPPDIVKLTTELGAWMLVLGNETKTVEAGRKRISAAIKDRSGLAKFREIVQAQGGDVEMIDDPDKLPAAAATLDVHATAAGHVTEIDALSVGVAGMLLGAGRQKVTDEIDPAVGVVLHAKRGDIVEAGQPVATLHVNDTTRQSEAKAMVGGAFTIGSKKPKAVKLIRRVIGK